MTDGGAQERELAKIYEYGRVLQNFNGLAHQLFLSVSLRAMSMTAERMTRMLNAISGEWAVAAPRSRDELGKS